MPAAWHEGTKNVQGNEDIKLYCFKLKSGEQADAKETATIKKAAAKIHSTVADATGGFKNNLLKINCLCIFSVCFDQVVWVICSLFMVILTLQRRYFFPQRSTN